MAKLRAVKFSIHYKQMNPGEIAYFSEEEAAAILKMGHGTEVKGESKPEPKKESAKK